MKNTFKIVSGGQTGVDRTALEWALPNGFAHGGWCPKGRKAEDGVIPPQFELKETDSANESEGTGLNVQNSDGTVISSTNSELTGGTKLTAEVAKRLEEPLLQLTPSSGSDEGAAWILAFIRQHRIAMLNIAGPRVSGEPGTGEFVKAVFSRSLRPTTR